MYIVFTMLYAAMVGGECHHFAFTIIAIIINKFVCRDASSFLIYLETRIPSEPTCMCLVVRFVKITSSKLCSTRERAIYLCLSTSCCMNSTLLQNINCTDRAGSSIAHFLPCGRPTIIDIVTTMSFLMYFQD